MQKLRAEEEWSRQMVEAALGLPVSQHDDGSMPGMHDLSIHHRDGSVGAVEVTAAAHPQSIALWKLVNDRDDRWIVPNLQGAWIVALHPRARARRLQAELPALLLAMERTGVTECHHPRSDRSGIEATAADLGIADLHHSATTDFPGAIYLTIEDDIDRRAGWSDASPAATVRWVGEFLASHAVADVRQKLARSGAAERHAFLVVPGFTTAPFGVVNLLMGHGVPGEPPTLPGEITHVWLVGTWNIGTGWRWDPGAGWQAFDRLQEQAG